MRVCKKCDVEKSLDKINFRFNNRYFLRTCRKCEQIDNIKWKIDNCGSGAIYSKILRDRNPGKYKAINKKSSDKRQREKPEEVRAAKRKDIWNVKVSVFSVYSGGIPKCECCGETTIEFLTIDHINGDGSKQRKELGMNGGNRFYRWLRANNYPRGYRVLCFNCNCTIGAYGSCPHKGEIIHG